MQVVVVVLRPCGVASSVSSQLPTTGVLLIPMCLCPSVPCRPSHCESPSIVHTVDASRLAPSEGVPLQFLPWAEHNPAIDHPVHGRPGWVPYRPIVNELNEMNQAVRTSSPMIHISMIWRAVATCLACDSSCPRDLIHQLGPGVSAP
ncbi:hypothetical protein LIA77_03740 [Sarocladium implicatum]|nr:hypothetical protein LIA77_03740 [Sarocladium implicatum]